MCVAGEASDEAVGQFLLARSEVAVKPNRKAVAAAMKVEMQCK